MGYVMHFLTPAYGPAYLLRTFHYDPVLKIGYAPPSGPGPTYITISSLLLQLRNEIRWAPSKSFHSRNIMTLS